MLIMNVFNNTANYSFYFVTVKVIGISARTDDSRFKSITSGFLIYISNIQILWYQNICSFQKYIISLKILYYWQWNIIKE